VPIPALTTQGLQIATLADVRDLINAKWRGFFAASMDVSDRSPDGQLIGIVSELFALLNELLEAIVSSQDPNKALDAALDAICALTGTKRRAATFSTVTLTLTGTPTTPITAGSLASTSSTGQQFTTQDAGDQVIAAATAWVGSTVYAAGDKRTNAGNIYLCTVGGSSAASGGPSGTTRGVDIVDSGATWRFLGAGTGFVDVPTRATVSGPVVAVSGDIINKDTPAGGWQDVINILDAAVGSPVMTNAQLRALREIELEQPGTSTKGAIRAALLGLTDGPTPVTSCTVFSNVTDVTDANGIPPHSVLAMVKGGANQDIWDALLDNVADGIRTFGTVIGTALDSEGTPQTMAFSRVTEIPVWVSVTVVVDPNAFPDDGAAQIAAAVATSGNALDDGTNVVASRVSAQVFAVPGVLDVALPLIGTTASPSSSTTIPISLFQRGVFDTSRIVVNTSTGVP